MDRIGDPDIDLSAFAKSFAACEGAPATIRPGAVVRMASELEMVLEWATLEKEPMGITEISSIRKTLASYYGEDND